MHNFIKCKKCGKVLVHGDSLPGIKVTCNDCKERGKNAETVTISRETAERIVDIMHKSLCPHHILLNERQATRKCPLDLSVCRQCWHEAFGLEVAD